MGDDDDKRRTLRAGIPDGKGSRLVSASPDVIFGLATTRLKDSVDEWIDEQISKEVAPHLGPIIKKVVQGMANDGSLPKVVRKVLDDVISATLATQSEFLEAQLVPRAEENVRKYIAEHWDDAVKATCEKAMREALSEVRERFSKKLGGGQ